MERSNILEFPQVGNVIRFPKMSDIDKQYIVLEKQQQLIRKQAKLIAENKDD